MFGYNLGTPALKPYKREIKTHQMVRFCEKKQRKTGLATNWKKSSSDEMGFKSLVFMRFPNKFV